MKTRRALLLLALAAALPAAQAQTGKWPEKPVRVVVPFAPGGTTDVVARMVAPRLSEEFGQQFIVDNRAGAGGSIGAEIVVRANPDGYTIMVGASSYASNAALYKLPYDPITGISPVTLITRAVHNRRAPVGEGEQPEGVHRACARETRQPQLRLVRHRQRAASCDRALPADDQHQHGPRPVQGRCPAIVDLLGGQIQFYFGGPLVLSPHINAGKLRGLAVTSEQRSPVMPDLPAVNELVPGYTAFTWFGMWAPPGTPKEIVARLNQAIARILKKPEVQERLRADGMEAAHNTPEEFSRFIARDIAKWTKVVKAGNIKVDWNPTKTRDDR